LILVPNDPLQPENKMISIPTNGKSMQPKFPLGQVLATPGALEALQASGQSAGDFLRRHVRGDWGDELCADDKQLNDEALKDGSRILSAYRTSKGTKLWIITEAQDDRGHREATTLLLPDEY
jgi:hypothetical protein